ncbi:DUF4974 domain-containing protein [Flavihumibacter sediminis]|nr:DUF4974 domain-containing protein [Flavihumibacter sediminis]
MITDRLWELVAKKLSGESSVQEAAELEELLRQHPEYHYPLQTISDLWFQQGVSNSADAGAAYERHIERMVTLGLLDEGEENNADLELNASPGFIRRNWLWMSGAVIVMVVGILYFLNPVLPSSQKELAVVNSEISTRNGSRSKLMLPDGTQVWLNSGSRITYSKDFGINTREVNLTGEAYFDVVKNAEKPFHIHAHNIDIKVLGTAFNVKSYPGEKSTETSLIRGSLEVSIKSRPSEKIILKPKEKLVVMDEERSGSRSLKPIAISGKNVPKVAIGEIRYAEIDSAVIETSWIENRLIFENESLRDIARNMERWYNVQIEFADEEVAEWRFKADFTKESLEEALRALSIATKFRYKINNDTVTISK